MLRRGYTLIEVIVTISIVAMLTILLVPNINRSLVKNNIAGDADVLSSKIESARLLAGSTQQADIVDPSDTADLTRPSYYGVYLPPSNSDTLQIIRVFMAQDPKYLCDPSLLITGTLPSRCVVDTIKFSQGVQMANQAADPSVPYRVILFKTPSQQVYYGDNSVDSSKIAITGPSQSPYTITLKSGTKTATININTSTGRVSGVSYN